MRPTVFSWIVVVAFMSFRVLSLMGLGKWEVDLNAADGIAFVWDALLAFGLVIALRLAPRPEAGRRLYAVPAYALVCAVVLSAFLARCADVAFCALTGGHWVSAGFLYLSATNLELLQDGDGPLLVAWLAGATLVTWVALWMDAHRGARTERTRRPALAVIMLAAVAAPLAVGFARADAAGIGHVPEGLFVHEWLAWHDEQQGASEHDLTLRSSTERRFTSAGLMPEDPVDPNYPLMRARLDPTPFPHPRVAGAPKYPNIVVTLVEQLNQEFVHSFSGDFEGLMPGLSALAERTTMLTEYQSTTSPTIHALVASLCSLHPTGASLEFNTGKGSEALVRTPLSCLPEILAELGYRTVFLQGGRKEFAGKSDFLLTHGFQEMHGRPELEAAHPEHTPSRWGMHDDLLVDYTQQQIERLEALQAQDGRPYFVMMLTLDTHSPGHAPASCKLPKELAAISKDKDSRTMLRSLYCVDKELSRLGRFILDDRERSRRTLWALSGDHPTSAMKFVRDNHKRHGRKYSGWSGRLPFILHDPLHSLPKKVPVLASHIDLAPTLLHLIGAPDVPNALTGHSVFGRRERFPVLIGRVGPQFMAVFRPDETISVTAGKLKTMCAERKPMLEHDVRALSACEVLAWVRWQDALWAQKRIMPPRAH